jgi:chromosome segregation ATPase
METVGISEGQTIPIETPITSVSYGAERDFSEIPDEIHKIQATVTELIGLFQQYREVIDARVDNIKSELESYINTTLDRRLNAFKHDLPSEAPERSHDYPVRQMIESVVEREMTLLELKRPLNGDVHRIREELARVKEDQARLVDKIRRINQLNCESHLRSLHAVKSIRDLINSRP